MQNYTKGFANLPATNYRIGMLMADFSGMNDLEKRFNMLMNRLILSDKVQAPAQFVQKGTWSKEIFDMYFAEVVRKELGKQLAIIRGKAKKKAEAAGAGSAAGAVMRRMYKDRLMGNINIARHHGRLSSRTRQWEPGNIKPRHVSKRTKQINQYYGPDRDFILRFLEGGTDVRYARSYGPGGRGSKATYGARGAIAPRQFFHTMSSDMELAAQQLGQSLIDYVEKFIDKGFNEE